MFILPGACTVCKAFPSLLYLSLHYLLLFQVLLFTLQLPVAAFLSGCFCNYYSCIICSAKGSLYYVTRRRRRGKPRWSIQIN